LSAVGLNFS